MSPWADNAGVPGTAGTPPPCQFRTIDDVARVLRNDFETNKVAAIVEGNEWQPEYHRGEARVVINYGRFSFATPSGADQPGPSIGIPDGSGDVGRAILDELQRFRVWCHHPGSGGPEPEAVRARRDAKELLAQTMRALREALAAPFREPPSGEWPKPWEQPQGYPDFIYGSFVSFEVMIPSPIIGGRLHVGTITAIEFSDSVSVDGGATTAPSGGGVGIP